MKNKLMSWLVGTSLTAISVGLAPVSFADTITSVTTTTTEAPVSTYHYRRVVTPVAVRPVVVEKSVTIKNSSVRSCSKSSCSTKIHKTAYVHKNYIAKRVAPRTHVIASSTTTKTVTRTTIEKPVVVEKIVKKPVYVNHYIDRPVYRDRVIEKSVVVNPSYTTTTVEPITLQPSLIKEKITHHSDHDTIKIKQYY